MLTKEERSAIAARVASYDGGILTWTSLYECLLDAPITGDVSIEEDSKYVIDCLIDLCDTSNMVELPLDKDGEVIRPGNVVYDSANEKYEVVGYMLYDDSKSVILKNGIGTEHIRPANNLTHKKPVTIASLVERMRDVLDDDDDMTAWVFSELSHIADQLEKLGDSNA